VDTTLISNAPKLVAEVLLVPMPLLQPLATTAFQGGRQLSGQVRTR
jgi:hypothetical protein